MLAHGFETTPGRLGASMARAAGMTVALGAIACGGAEARPQGPSLWPYTGDAARIFDDAFDLQAVGYGADPIAQAADEARFRERTQIADAVLRVRMTGVNAKPDGSGGWVLTCHTLEQLAGKRPPPADFDLDVAPTAPGAGILKQFASRVAGAAFIVFVEEFAAPPGQKGTQLHFHVSTDSPEEVTAVREASALGGAR